jgi:hypothetical protein
VRLLLLLLLWLLGEARSPAAAGADEWPCNAAAAADDDGASWVEIWCCLLER